MLSPLGWGCRVFCGPALDFEAGKSHEQLLCDERLAFEVKRADLGGAVVSLLHFRQGDVDATIFRPENGPRPVGPRRNGRAYLALLERVLEDFRPDVLLTYGGDRLARDVISAAKRRGIRVVFWLQNMQYHDASLFAPVDLVLVPSRFSAEHYRKSLGLRCAAIPVPLDWSRIRCEEIDRRYLTFVNPQPAKGVFLVARIAEQLARRRPEIPLLVVEGRGRSDWLRRTGLDLSKLTNLHRMANTPDPRDFYRVSRAVLMPSLWCETFGRVAAEGLINGLPVLASGRGALPETLREAGFTFAVPDRFTPASRIVPDAEIVEPWLRTIERLWDDETFYAEECRRSRTAADAWRPERLSERYDCVLTTR
ncbi:MAG: glycosyltransferase [Planctomycetaceae bacterium]